MAADTTPALTKLVPGFEFLQREGRLVQSGPVGFQCPALTIPVTQNDAPCGLAVDFQVVHGWSIQVVY